MTSDARWRTSLHEAAHGIAAIALGDRCLGLVLLDDNSGLAQNDELLGDRQAFAVGSGPVAEKLAEQYPAPATPPAQSKLLTVDEIEALPIFQSAPGLACQLARMPDDRRHSDCDERFLALWAITGSESVPGSWAGRVEHARRMAGLIVDRNVDAILRVATALFVAGSLSETEILNHMEG